MPKLQEAPAGPKEKVKKEGKAPTPAQAPAKSRIQTVGLEDVTEHLNILYYGEGGSGKTTNLAFMANEGRVLFVNSEAGLKRKPLARLGVNVANIQVYPDPDDPEADISFEALEELFWQIKGDLHDDPKSWAGTAWDSGTEIHKKLLDSIVADQVKKAEQMGKDRDRFFIDRADWGQMTEQVRFLLRRYRDLPCHFGVSALERRDQDHDGIVRFGPALTPALQSDIVGYMDVVCHATVEQVGDEDEYRGLFRKSGKFSAKDRFGALPRRLVDPNFERVLAYINDDLDEDSDPVMSEALKRRREVEEQTKASAASKG